jgi:hypothetical protein
MKEQTKKVTMELRPLTRPMLFGLVRVGTLCVGMCLITMAVDAQQSASGAVAPSAANTTGGWWSPLGNESPLAIPQLHLRIANPAYLDEPDTQRSSRATKDIYPISEYANSLTTSEAVFELAPRRLMPQVSTLAQGQLLSAGSFLPLPSGKYATWEAGLSDSRTLTNVNGILVYPLIEIDYAQWHLPITLYVPPLRGTAAR